jgi:hypothetical protein
LPSQDFATAANPRLYVALAVSGDAAV